MAYTTKTFVVDQLYDVVDANDMANNDEHLKDLISEGHNWNATTPPSIRSHFMHVTDAHVHGTLNTNTFLNFSPGLFFVPYIPSDLHRIMRIKTAPGGVQYWGTYINLTGGNEYSKLIMSDGSTFKIHNSGGSNMYFRYTVLKYNRSK